MARQLEGSGLEVFVLEASVSLTATQRRQSDPKITAGHYLGPTKAAVWFQGVSSGNKVSEESRCQLPVRRAESRAIPGQEG